jgi:hypothetical protein
MVLFCDGTWRLCRADGWQRDGEGWRVLLRWGVAGEWYAQWYLYEAAKVREMEG